MAKNPRKGDTVHWRSHGRDVRGTVEERITRRRRVAGRLVDASPDEPQYRVRSAATGRDAVHRPAALHREPTRVPGRRPA
ncbi:DUF2945 domain-containing protein [Pilimelia anulata]|nr:DUF2945 domain-containing protein [Pilimelia anulata]